MKLKSDFVKEISEIRTLSVADSSIVIAQAVQESNFECVKLEKVRFLSSIFHVLEIFK